jgi:hypothetical protein
MNRTGQRFLSAASGLILAGFALPAAAATGTAATGTAAGVAAGSSGVVRIVHHGNGTFNVNQSSNWSGYNIGADYPQVPTGTLFTSVSGEWKVPTASLHSSADSSEDSATWVGIGGGCVNDTCQVTDNTLIQAGTSQDVTNSGGTVTTSYDAWWEIIPEPETEVSLPVAPGNVIKVTIAETSTPGDWSIEIQNLTTHKKFTTTTPYSSSEDTVEWIEETPLEIGTTGTGLATMPNLTKVHVYDASYNGANPAFQAIDEMQLDNNSMIEATPSAPGSAKNSFNDCTWATTCGAP